MAASSTRWETTFPVEHHIPTDSRRTVSFGRATDSPRESLLKHDILPEHPISGSDGSIPENMRQRTFETSEEVENLPGGGRRVVKVTKEREVGSSRTTSSSEYSSRTPTPAGYTSVSTPGSTLTRESRTTLNAPDQHQFNGYQRTATPEPERERRYVTKLNTFADKVSDLRQKNRQMGSSSGGGISASQYDRERDRINRERAEFESRMESLEREIEEHKRSSVARPEWYREPHVPGRFDRIDEEILRMEQDFDRFCRTNQSAGPLEIAKFRDGHDFDKFFITSPIVEEHGQKKFKQTFDLARFKPEEVSITTRDNCVSIEAKHISKGGMSASEYEYKREFALPDGVRAEELESTYKPDGTLVIEAPFRGVLPKLDAARSIPIRRQ